jgi:hypothetical protein
MVMKTVNLPERPNYMMLEVSGAAFSYYKQHVIDLSNQLKDILGARKRL